MIFSIFEVLIVKIIKTEIIFRYRKTLFSNSMRFLRLVKFQRKKIFEAFFLLYTYVLKTLICKQKLESWNLKEEKKSINTTKCFFFIFLFWLEILQQWPLIEFNLKANLRYKFFKNLPIYIHIFLFLLLRVSNQTNLKRKSLKNIYK